MARKRAAQGGEQPVLSRKHISRAEREARQRQRAVLGFAVVTAAVLLILGVGAVYSAFFEPRQAMAQVEDETITRREFFQRVNYQRYRLFQIIEETRTQILDVLAQPTAAFFAQFYQQQLAQLQGAYLQIGAQTLEEMIEEIIIEREAAQRGITVTEAEVDEEIRRQMAQQEGAQIEADVTATAVAGVAATATAELFTPTPSPTADPLQTPEATEEIGVTDPITPTATPFPTLTPAPTPTPNILTDEAYTANYQAFLADLRRYVGYSEQDFRRVIYLQLLRTRLSEAIGAEAEVTTTEEQVHARHILVETEEEVQGVIERLNEGEDFAALAMEVSTDTGSAQQGGDLGWFGRGRMVPAFEEAAFALAEPGQISEPVESQFGWHIIQLIEGPEERELPQTDIEQQRQAAFTTFLSEAKTELEVDRFWDFDDLPRDPFIDRVREPLPTPVPTPTLPVQIDLTPPAGFEPEPPAEPDFEPEEPAGEEPAPADQ